MTAGTKIRADVARAEAVRREGSQIMRTPIGSLDYASVNNDLRSAWTENPGNDTFIAFVDEVQTWIKRNYRMHERHTEWLSAHFGAA